MSLGRLREAVPFYKRLKTMYINAEDWSNASHSDLNLVFLHTYLGTLKPSADAAASAVDLARRAKNKDDEILSVAIQAWALHLKGETETASELFSQAEKLEQQDDSSISHLTRNAGVRYANHLWRTGKTDYARMVADANLRYCDRNHWGFLVSRCHCILGDLDADAGQHASAHEHYDTALKITRSISYRPALIEALLARGRWTAKYMKDATSAFNDLNEALGYAVEGGYRIYEADIRVALAWAHLTPIPIPSPSLPSASLLGPSAVDAVDRGREQARVEAERALQMSEEMGYYWGKVDAEEVLNVIRGT